MPFSPLVTVIDRKDAGRVQWAATTQAAASVVAEALLSLNVTRDGATAAAATTHTVTANKRLRLTSLTVTARASAAVASWARIAIRFNPSGAATASSTLMFAVEVGTPTATIGATETVTVPLDATFEFVGANQIGVTHIGAATSVLETVSLNGYEYQA